MLSEKKIKNGTRINIINSINEYKFYTIVGLFRNLRIWREEEGKEDILLERVLDTEDLVQCTFEILEDKTEEIEEIEVDSNNYIHTELGSFKGRKMDIAFVNKLNELTKIVNKLNSSEQK